MVLGIIALILVVGVVGCVALIGGVAKKASDELGKNNANVVENGTGAPSDSDASAGDSSTGSREVPLPIGSEIDLGNGWRVKVNSADVSPAANAAVEAVEYNEAAGAGMRYIVMNVTATFSGRDEVTTEAPLFGFDYAVFGSDKTERQNSDTYASAPEPALDGMADLASGGSATGNVVVSVGAEESGLAVRLEPSFTFDSTEAWVSLGEITSPAR